MEYVAINIFMKHLFFEDDPILWDSEFFRIFETLNSEYRRAARKVGK